MKQLALLVALLATVPAFANPLSPDAKLCLTRGSDCHIVGFDGYAQGYLAIYFALNDGNYLVTLRDDRFVDVFNLETSPEGFEDVFQAPYLTDLFQTAGSDPDPPLPEPGTLGLVGSGLLLATFGLRRYVN